MRWILYLVCVCMNTGVHRFWESAPWFLSHTSLPRGDLRGIAPLRRQPATPRPDIIHRKYVTKKIIFFLCCFPAGFSYVRFQSSTTWYILGTWRVCHRQMTCLSHTHHMVNEVFVTHTPLSTYLCVWNLLYFTLLTICHLRAKHWISLWLTGRYTRACTGWEALLQVFHFLYFILPIPYK